MMSEDQQQPVAYQPGQIVNGHVWTGTEWLPVVQAAKPTGSSSTWKLIAAIVAFVVTAVAGIQGMYWLGAFLDLEGDGNPFAGILALLGMGALAVAAGFGIAGIMLLNKR
jgi:apolipoprotein N-acyltransferase